MTNLITNFNGSRSERIRVLGISGSLREASYNTALLRVAQELAPESVEITLFDLKTLPFYDGDVEAQGDPEAVTAFKEAIRNADAILFATPEYNFSTSGVLKNAVDWASRDHEEGSLDGKPVTIIGAGGMSGTASAQKDLRHILSGLGSLVMVKPGVLVAGPWSKFDSDGRLLDEETSAILRNHLEAFANWIERVGTHREALAS